MKSSAGERFDEDITIDDSFLKTIKLVIDGWDPINLLSHAPRDEYDSEIAQICQLMNSVQDSIELGKGIHQIFERGFGSDVFRESIDDCIVMARFVAKYL